MDCASDPSGCLDQMGILDNKVDGKCIGASLNGLFQFVSFMLFLLGALGNAAFLIVTTRSYQQLSSTDMFLVGLAGFDFIASIFLPLVYFLEISELVAQISHSACQFMSLMHEVSVVLTVYVLIFTVHSFYRKIPNQHQRPEGYKRIRVFGLMALSVLFVVVPSVPIIVDTRVKNGRCHVEMKTFTSVVIYDVVLFFLQVILPILIFTIMFAQLGALLHYPVPRSQSQEEPDLDLMELVRNKRKLVLLLVLTCSFYALFLPYVFAHLWFLLDGGRFLETRFSCYLYDVFHLVICGKCVLNPIIYLALYEGFRENLKRIMCGFKIGRKHNFMPVNYQSKKRHQEKLIDGDAERDEGQMLNEMGDWQPTKRDGPSSPLDPGLELDENEHDYEEENETVEDSVAILRPFKHLRSTSAL